MLIPSRLSRTVNRYFSHLGMFHCIHLGFARINLFESRKNRRLMILGQVERPVWIIRANLWRLNLPVTALFLLLLPAFKFCEASGYFQIQVGEFNNSRGRLADGACCRHEEGRSGCSLNCRTYFRVCLKEYQSEINPDGPCTFGNVSSGILGGNYFAYSSDTSKARLTLRFEFAWTTSYTLILEAREDLSNFTGQSQLIERVSHRGVILPGQKWHTFTHEGRVASITHRIRVVCHTHYYNTTCTKFCRPRDDAFGHYSCGDHGDKACLAGWMGRDCTTPICLPGCHATHGSCDKPGVCNCEFGWQGPLCDQCIPYPGCLYGTCKNAWTCECDLNWGGLLCNKDLNYCGTHQPCVNGGICSNERPDEYSCACPEGFSGQNCEIGVNECTSSPCQNGGLCQNLADHFTCHCLLGWQGSLCEIPTPHLGDSCRGTPCGVHAVSCVRLQRSMSDGLDMYRCICQQGWTGDFCDEDVNDCVGQCKNGATCLDLVNTYQCTCAPGYTGHHCEKEVDECESDPCQNGAICRDILNGFICKCPTGFYGTLCQEVVNMCRPDPCKNGGQCYDLQGDYFCRCIPGFEGKDCARKKPDCPDGICEVIDSCSFPVASNEPQDKFRRVSSNVCGRHGICWTFPNGEFSCRCQPGYQGRYCHENINDCATLPCQNNGTCIDAVNGYQCVCAPGWAGPNCTQDIDDCTPNPCHNGGICTDKTNDFECACANGWKGKICISRISQCDGVICSNGGMCIALENSYHCACVFGYHGTNCHIPSWSACDSNPCRNGGTCVNSGDSVTCLCKEGYEGYHCEHDKNDCDPFPCYNGAQCVDGVNWYICDCAKGFAGPDCRININDCASHPCAYGSTCIDGVGAYKCLCPPGRTGQQCDEVIGVWQQPTVTCSFRAKTYVERSSWMDGCNSCQCIDGRPVCTKIWCGPGNCLTHPNVSEPIAMCTAEETCVVQTTQTCLTSHCLPWGQCRHVSRIEDGGPRGMRSTCLPNRAVLSNNCARIDILFDKSRLPKGVSVENICNALRTLPQLHSHTMQSTLIILCAVHASEVDTIQITVSLGVPSETAPTNPGPTLRALVEKIATAVSRRKTNSSALDAVVDVQVETKVITDNPGNGYPPVIPVLCAVVSVLGVVSLGLVVFWFYRHRRRRHYPHRRSYHAHNCGQARRDGVGGRTLRPSSANNATADAPYRRNALFDAAELIDIHVDAAAAAAYEKGLNHAPVSNSNSRNSSNSSSSSSKETTAAAAAAAAAAATATGGRVRGAGPATGPPNIHRHFSAGSGPFDELKPLPKMTNVEISRTLTPNNNVTAPDAVVERELIM